MRAWDVATNQINPQEGSAQAVAQRMDRRHRRRRLDGTAQQPYLSEELFYEYLRFVENKRTNSSKGVLDGCRAVLFGDGGSGRQRWERKGMGLCSERAWGELITAIRYCIQHPKNHPSSVLAIDAIYPYISYINI